MIYNTDLWDSLCRLMHQLAIRNGSTEVITRLEFHWIKWEDNEDPICLVCNKTISQSFSNMANYDHAKQHAKEYNLLVLL